MFSLLPASILISSFIQTYPPSVLMQLTLLLCLKIRDSQVGLQLHWWLSTFLMLQYFTAVPSVGVTQARKIICCYFTTNFAVVNHNVII